MGISTIRDRRAKVTNRARSTPTRPGPTFMGCEAISTGSCCSLWMDLPSLADRW